MPIVLYPIESGFNIKKRGCQPSVSLVGVLPGIDFATALFNQGIDRLKTIGGLKRTPKQRKDAQLMQSEGFLEAFSETGGSGLIAPLKLLVKDV